MKLVHAGGSEDHGMGASGPVTKENPLPRCFRRLREITLEKERERGALQKGER